MHETKTPRNPFGLVLLFTVTVGWMASPVFSDEAETTPPVPEAAAMEEAAAAAESVETSDAATESTGTTADSFGSGPASVPAANPWAVPAEGSCAPEGGLLGTTRGSSEDALPALPFAPGDTFGLEGMEILKNYLPDFLWQQREKFFFDGMRLEIGPCFQDYSAPAFYHEATEKFKGQASLNEENGLVDYGAGRPFASEGIVPGDPKAGDKWLWNTEFRYQGAGFHGPFRVVDLVGRIGRAEAFEGEMFKIQLGHRADRAEDDYVAPGSRGNHFVAGGIFFKPFDARENSWRQFRDEDHLVEKDRSDDLHAYLPQWRRVRRISASQVEGLYMPSFSVGLEGGTQIVVGAGAGAGGGGASAGGAGGGGSVHNKRSGYEGLVFRPNKYETKVVGLHDILAPINSKSGGYPENPDRDFGPWGLSLASDTWDLRRALVLEMRAKEPLGTLSDRQILYVDLQTLQPLYMATFDKKNEMTNIGAYAARWSEDREGYPGWPHGEGQGVRILDSVTAAFANLAESGSWRRESWTNVGTPPNNKTVRRMSSVSQLTKGR